MEQVKKEQPPVEAGSKLPVMDNYGTRAITLVRGSGVHVYDDTGRAYLDLTAGIAVCALGHAHPAITQAIVEQAETLIHCSNLYMNPWQLSVAAQLTTLSGLEQAFFCNSGTEANEAAIKLARKVAAVHGEGHRVEIVSLPGAFHGRTLGALSITPKAAYQEGFTPLLPGCVTPPDWAGAVAAIGPQTAGCIVEVVQGEGGINVVPAHLLLAIQERCKAVGALFMIDEVQTGVGRTGSFFAFQQCGLDPDVVTMAKGLGGGVPVGAVLAKSEVAAAFSAGTHGSTFGGNPLAMAVAGVVCNIVSHPEFLAHIREVGAYLQAAVAEFGTNVSGLGLMVGMTVENAKDFVATAASAGVLVTAVGPTRVRFVPPLILEKSDVDEMSERLATIR